MTQADYENYDDLNKTAGTHYEDEILKDTSEEAPEKESNDRPTEKYRRWTKNISAPIVSLGVGVVVGSVAAHYFPEEAKLVKRLLYRAGVFALTGAAIHAATTSVEKEIDDFYDGLDEAIEEQNKHMRLEIVEIEIPLKDMTEETKND